ncbi:YcxB family protein [Abyssisolibacter fermentans]|uniref:YcxB family protein n=1 Tax=Abyssisolibacter fermentans TaxID=1766203 RepID=UPI000833B0E0|nr:YcxB family protein [Abyssisolibacter fermentans]
MQKLKMILSEKEYYHEKIKASINDEKMGFCGFMICLSIGILLVKFIKAKFSIFQMKNNIKISKTPYIISLSFLLLFITQFYLIRKNHKKQFSKNDIIKCTCIASEYGLFFTFNKEEYQCRWEDIFLVEESRKYIRVFLNQSEFILMKKSDIEGRELIEFKELLNRKLDKKSNELLKAK